MNHAGAKSWLVRLVGCLIVTALVVQLAACGGRRPAQSTSAPADRTFQQLCKAADTALVEQGDAMLAYKLYSQAIDRAYTMTDPAAIAVASFGQAASLARLRRYEQAIETLNSTGVAAPPEDRLARTLLAARIRLQQGQADPAQSLLQQAESLTKPSTPSATRMLIRLTRGQLAMMNGDSDAAKQAVVEPATLRSPGLLIQSHRLNGLIAEDAGQHAAAAQAFEAEAQAARRASNWPGAAEATARAGDAYAAAVNPSKAAVMYYQAGRSAVLQQDAGLPVDQWLRSAREQAVSAADDDLLELIQQLEGQIKPSGGSP